MKEKINKVYMLLIPIMILGIYVGYSSFLVCVVLLIFRLLYTNRHTAGLFLLMYGGPIGGVVRYTYPSIPIYGLALGFLGLLLMSDKVVEFLKYRKKSMLFMLLIFIIFLLCFFNGPQDEYASNKMINIFFHGTFMLFGYYLLDKSSKIDTESLTQILLLSVILFFVFFIKAYNFSVGGVFNYEWFRVSCESYIFSFKEDLLINYQTIGMTALYGIAIFLSQKDLKSSKTILYAICAVQLIMCAGARQAIVGFLLLIVVRFVFFRKKAKSKRPNLIVIIVSSAILLYLLLLGISIISPALINSTVEDQGSGRVFIYLQALSVFNDHQLFGAGLGGFHYITQEVYPHNFFLEILCECGLVGLVSLLFVVSVYFIRNKITIRRVTTSNSYYFVIILALFTRIMFSSDLTESIELFSACFVLTNTLHINKTSSV